MVLTKAIRWILLSLLLIHGLPSFVMAQEDETEAAREAGKEAALAWLALVDDGDYGSSWDQAGTLLQDAVTKEGWAAAATSARGQIEALAPGIDYATRGLMTASYAVDPPNAPPGEYVIAQYAITHNDQKVIETISLKREGEAWKVVGYFIQPEQ